VKSAGFGDMGLLWLESHFASVFGNESGWNDDEDFEY
jgi:hypothetical protein